MVFSILDLSLRRRKRSWRRGICGERVCVEEVKEVASYFFCSKKCSRCLCMEGVGPMDLEDVTLPGRIHEGTSLGLLTKRGPPWPIKPGMCD